MIDRLTAIRDLLQAHADVRSRTLTGWGPTKSEYEVRDTQADALADLAEAVLELAKRVEETP